MRSTTLDMPRRLSRWKVTWMFLRSLTLTLLGLAVFLGLFAAVAGLIAYFTPNGLEIVIYSLIVGSVFALLGFLFSEPIVVLSTKSQKLDKNDPIVMQVAEVAKRAGIRCPRVYIVPDEALNAFACGVKLPIPYVGGRGAIGLTKGLVGRLNERQLNGVIAHELTHLESFDLLIAAGAGALIAALTMVQDLLIRRPDLFFRGGSRAAVSGGSGSWSSSSSGSSRRRSSSSGNNGGGDWLKGLGALLALIIKWIIAIVVILAVIAFVIVTTQYLMPMVRAYINRQREYWADAGAALTEGGPEGLIEALRIISEAPSTEVRGVNGFSNAFFNAPAMSFEGRFMRLLSTHPDTDDRIRALADLAA